MRKLLVSVPILLVLLLVPALAHAAAGEDEIGSIVRAIAYGILHGDYLASTAFAVSLVTTLVRISWSVGGLGGRVILGVNASAASLGAALVAGAELSWGVAQTALLVGIAAAGGYSLLQPLARWLRPHIERRVPQPLRGLLLALLRLVDVDPPAQPPASTRATTAPITVALLLGLVMVASSCATVRRAGAAGAAAGLDCTSESIRSTVDEAGAFARAFVLGAITGDQVDATALRSAARELKSEALRCSLVAAIAAIAAGAESTGDGPRTLLSQPVAHPDPILLRDLARQLAEREWGIYGPIVVESGTL